MRYSRTRRYLENKCIRCGKEDENTHAGKTLCLECTAHKAKLRKELREFRKANHLCVDCGTKDNRTLSGKTRCFLCAESEKDYNKRIREKKKLLHK